MIYLYSGIPGSGKSLHAAKLILESCGAGKPVIANFMFDTRAFKHPQRFHFWPNADITPARLMDFSRDYFGSSKPREEQIVLIIDEAQLLFNSRSWQDKGRNDWIVFLSQHRHFGYQVVLIAQSDRMIDRQIRALIEYDVQHRKASSFGVGGRLLGLVLGNYCAVTVYHGLKDKIGSKWFRGSKRLYRLYNSYSLFEGKVQDD